MKKYIRISKKLTIIILTFLVIGISGLILPRYANSESITDFNDFYECTGDALADFLNALLLAKSMGLIPENIKILSPAFNLTSFTFDGITSQMMNNMDPSLLPYLDGIAVNVYNTGNNTIDGHIEAQKLLDKFPGMKIYITETGRMPDGGSNMDVINTLKKMQDDYRDTVEMACLFVPTGSNPDFDRHRFSDDELKYMCSVLDCDKVCINYGTYFGGQSYGDANGYNMGGILQIAENGGEHKVIESIRGYGGTPIIRIGTAGGSGGYRTPQDYINSLNQIGNALPGQDIFAIGGPNEPDLEYWLAPWCALQNPDAVYACGGQLNLDIIPYRGEVVGHNNEKPWSIYSDLADKHERGGSLGLDPLANVLKSDFVITSPYYYHDDFEVMNQQLSGSLDPNSVHSIDTRTDKDNDGKGKILYANIPWLNSAIPDKTIPTSYGVAPQEYLQEGEEFTPYLKRLVQTTITKNDGLELGYDADMPTGPNNNNSMFMACIQRTTCNPRKEECLSVETGEPCGILDRAKNCVSLGKKFTMHGDINFEEPPDLHGTGRAFEHVKREMVDIPGKVYDKNDIVSTKDINYAYLRDNPESIEKFAQIQADKVIANSESLSQKKDSYLDKLSPDIAYAQPSGMAPPTGSMSVNVISDDGATIQIGYQLCYQHQPGSSCSMRDLNANVEGVEIFRFSASTVPDLRCLSPGDGGLPASIGRTLYNGDCTTVSGTVSGPRVGPEGCPDSVGGTCTICRSDGSMTNNDGAVVPAGDIAISDCTEAPPAPPVDCRVCESWAPDWLCPPIVAPEIIQESECSTGECRADGLKFDPEVPLSTDSDDEWDFDTRDQFALIRWLLSILGLERLQCEAIKEKYNCDLFGRNCSERTVGYQCVFNAKDYLIYAYPIYVQGDFSERSINMAIHNAMFEYEGKTDRYFVPKSTKAPMTLKLELENQDVEGEGAGESNLEPNPGGAGRFELGDEAFWIGLNDNGIRTMYVEYELFMQPQVSGQCLKQRLLSAPIDGRLVPESHNELCAQQDFWPGSISANSQNSDPRKDYSNNNDKTNPPTTIAEFNVDEQIISQAKEFFPNDPGLNPKYDNARDDLVNEIESILQKYPNITYEDIISGKPLPENIQKELDAIAQRIIVKYNIQG